jgi:transposase
MALSRSAAVAKELLGPPYTAIVSSDRSSAHHWLAIDQRQLCWAHRQRDFQAMVDRGQQGRSLDTELLCGAEDLFNYGHRILDGTLQRSTLRPYVRGLRRQVQMQLALGSVCGWAKTKATCRDLSWVEPVR